MAVAIVCLPRLAVNFAAVLQTYQHTTIGTPMAVSRMTSVESDRRPIRQAGFGILLLENPADRPQRGSWGLRCNLQPAWRPIANGADWLSAKNAFTILIHAREPSEHGWMKQVWQ